MMREDVPPSLMRYVFRLSPACLARSPSSFMTPACSLVTALVTSKVLPWMTSLLARLDDGSTVRTDGRANGFLLGAAAVEAPTAVALAPVAPAVPYAPVSACTRSASSIAASACSVFQKHTKPVPRDRPVDLSMVIRAYRRGPNVRNLVVSLHCAHRRGGAEEIANVQTVELLLGDLERQVAHKQGRTDIDGR